MKDWGKILSEKMGKGLGFKFGIRRF